MKLNNLQRVVVILSVILSMVGGSNVRSDVAPPAAIRMPRDTKPAVSGVEYSGAFDVYVFEPGVLADFKLEGEGWTILSLETPADPGPVDEGLVEIPFRAVPEDADQALRLSLTHNRRRVSKSYRVGPEYFSRIGKGRALEAEGGFVDDKMTEPLPKKADQGQAQSPDDGVYRLQFEGRFVYTREDGRTVGVDNILVEVMDDDGLSGDPLVDERIWWDYTDDYGYFNSGVIEWDDCDVVGCDDPDIYVRFECDTPVGQVQGAGVFEVDYNWSTMNRIHEDFTGEKIDFGTLRPADNSEMPALHIWNSLVRTHRFILNAIDLNSDHVDVQWPDDEEVAHYSSDFDEIYIPPKSQWHEGTFIHEYGHHFMEKHSVNPSHDYCNGFCDEASGVPGCWDTPREDCGHCRWCQEKSPVSWKEGFPNWLGDTVPRSFERDYQFDDCTPYTPIKGRNYENIGKCCQDDQWHDPWQTEGFVSALLRDIDDRRDYAHDPDDPYDNDDDDEYWEGWPDTTDCMNLGPEEILAVVTQDRPETAAEFITDFVSRYPQRVPALWKTAMNIHPSFTALFPADTQPPGPVTVLESPTHPIGVGGSLPFIAVEFEQPADDVTGSKGFSVKWTADPAGVVPPESINWFGSCVSRALSPAFGFGEYYVSIRAVDWEDHWGPTTTFGPFVINGDCNGNGNMDLCDIIADVGSYAKIAGLPCPVMGNLCEGITGISLDCNQNLVPDECDLASGTSKDCNQNGIPDECESLLHWASGNGSWHNANNWHKRSECPDPPPPPICDYTYTKFCPATPESGDNICINNDYSDITVTYGDGETEIGLLACYESLDISGGSFPATLSVSEPSWVQGDLGLSGSKTALVIGNQLEIGGLFTWTGTSVSGCATLTGTGMTYANGGVQIHSGVHLEEHRLILDGDSTSVGDGRVIFVGASVFEIRPGSTYEHQGGLGFLGGSRTGSFVNKGTLIKSTDPGPTSISVPTNNSGLIHVKAGTLKFHEGGSSTGEFRGDPGTTIEFGGNHALLGSSSIVADNVTFRTGGGTVHGTYNITASTTNSATILNFTSEANILSYGASFYIPYGTVNFNPIIGEPIRFNTLSIGPGATGDGTANFSSGDPIQVTNLILGPGRISGPSPITIDGQLTWNAGGDFYGPGTVTANGDVLVNVNGDEKVLRDCVYNNAATATFLGGFNRPTPATVNNLETGVIDIQADVTAIGGYGEPVNNAGRIVKTAGASTSTIMATMNNTGTVEVQTGVLRFYTGYGGSYTQTAGQTLLNGGDLLMAGPAPLRIDGGRLTGAGTVTGNIVNAGGTVEPGLSVGTLQVDGNYSQRGAATLIMEIGGEATCTAVDKLVITGSAALGGTLNIRLIDGCEPGLDDTFVILTSGQPLSGTFAKVTGQGLGNGLGLMPVYNTNDVTLQVVQCVAPDWDCNECVDSIDLATFAIHWKHTGCTATDWCGGADFNQDGSVNLADLGELAAHWLEHCP